MARQTPSIRRPLALCAAGLAFLIFWIYALVPAWLRQPSVPSTLAARTATASEPRFLDSAGWTATTFFQRTYLAAGMLHPDSAAGRLVRRHISGDVYILALGIDNTKGTGAVSIDPDAIRVYTFSGTSTAALDPDRCAVTPEAHAAVRRHRELLTRIEPGTVARTCLIFLPGTLDADRVCSLELRINGIRYTLEGTAIDRSARTAMAPALRLLTLDESEPLLHRAAEVLPTDFAPPAALDIPQ